MLGANLQLFNIFIRLNYEQREFKLPYICELCSGKVGKLPKNKNSSQENFRSYSPGSSRYSWFPVSVSKHFQQTLQSQTNYNN